MDKIVFSQMLQSFSFWGTFVPQTPYRGFTPGLHWGLPSPYPPVCLKSARRRRTQQDAATRRRRPSQNAARRRRPDEQRWRNTA